MSYIDQNLITGERVTYRPRLHWFVFLKPAITSAILAALAGLAFYLNQNSIDNSIGNSNGSSIGNWIGAGLLVIAAIPLIVASVLRSSAEFAVTNKRVILKTGFIQKKTAEMFLHKIESVGVDQSIMGRMFGYGSIVIRGTGGTLEPFGRISAPLEFRRQIQEQIGQTFDRNERFDVANPSNS